MALFPVAPAASAALSDIRANDNHRAAGKLEAGVLALTLETGTGIWHFDGDDKPGVPMQAFAEAGSSLQIPGPLIRVPAGTEVSLSIRNTAETTLVLHGLFDRPAASDAPVPIPAGEARTVRFKLSTPGTYFYWGSTADKPIAQRMGIDSQFSGAIVVDPPGVAADPKEEILVLSEWLSAYRSNGAPVFPAALAVINGRSWPATERLSYVEGESVHWRWINTSFEDHPLHLHGFYFRIDSRGDALVDKVYRTEAEREDVVTELVQVGETRTITWVPSRPGNWVFHCHNPYHVRSHFAVDLLQSRSFPFRNTPEWDAALASTHEMGGMVLGVTVEPKPGKEPVAEAPARRRVLLTAVEEPAGEVKTFRYVLGDKPDASAPSAAGPPIILTRGVPTSITVRNRLSEMTTVHWHGIELESSYYDGVAEFGGDPRHGMAPMIHPGHDFEARFTPPRAGTFMYHTHMNDVEQLEAGLAGPLIVLEPGRTFDPAVDHVVLVTVPAAFADQGKFALVNGVNPPQAIDMRTGERHRLRVINLHSFENNLTVQLKQGPTPMLWRALAKDGRNLPAARQTLKPSRQMITLGESYDFEFVAEAPGDYTLELSNQRFGKVLSTVPIHVGGMARRGAMQKSSLAGTGGLASAGDWTVQEICRSGTESAAAAGPASRSWPALVASLVSFW